MEQNTQLKDPVFDKVSETTQKDQALADPMVGHFLEFLRNELEADNDFGVKHGFLALSKAMIYLTQSLCENEEQFQSELTAAQSVAINRVMPSILPKISNEGKIVEEGYDLENLSIRRLMMTVGTAVDYIFWRNEVSKYSETRAELEEELAE